jgi:BirA family biotin operon repressor/biotin-[acetyl-CoA-carboxylase] ligase
VTTAADLQWALASAGLEAPVHWHEVTGSTNAAAAELAEEGAPAWTLVGAGHQTAGRGRLGRAWQDRAGRALIVSIVLRPAIPLGRASLLGLWAGAAASAAAEALARLDVRCKWPNDLVLGEAKAGGILAESSIEGDRLRYVVLGVGINLDAPEDVPGAIGLGPSVEAGELLGGLLRELCRPPGPEDPGFPEAVVARWTARSATLGRDVEARRLDGTRVRGTAMGLDPSGALILSTSEGPRAVATGEIEHLR